MKHQFLYILAAVAMVACAPKQQTERLICAEAEMNAFPYSENGLKVSKHQTVTPVEGVAGLEVVETYFVNDGKPVTVKAYELCRTEIEAQDSIVWSLQPSSTSARMDWHEQLRLRRRNPGGGPVAERRWHRDWSV